jgi:hypothetical protein
VIAEGTPAEIRANETVHALRPAEQAVMQGFRE